MKHFLFALSLSVYCVFSAATALAETAVLKIAANGTGINPSGFTCTEVGGLSLTTPVDPALMRVTGKSVVANLECTKLADRWDALLLDAAGTGKLLNGDIRFTRIGPAGAPEVAARITFSNALMGQMRSYLDATGKYLTRLSIVIPGFTYTTFSTGAPSLVVQYPR